MIFNSYLFLLLFLPISLAGFTLLLRLDREQAMIWFLAVASLVFYAAWDVNYVPLLLGSVVINYALGQGMMHAQPGRTRSALLVLGILFNLGLLGYFKYANFFLQTANHLGGTGFDTLQIMLPLAISFFTFQQIAYLVDIHSGACEERNFGRYLLFVCFFPQLIAGPIVHHKEMMPQFNLQMKRHKLDEKRAQGIMFLVLGLTKKVIIADSLAPYAIALFESETTIGFTQAWLGTLAYTFQLYFDFSGYTDMAIGIALLFGIRLPDNFDSPYKSRSIIEFWRRWHITLSRFLRDYLYIALGGNRKGVARRYANLAITMLLGGLWHGAAWTFVIWGGLHGLMLVINHGWHFLLRTLGITWLRDNAVYGVASWVLTFLAVHHCWVVFRANSTERAMEIYRAMYSPAADAGEATDNTELLVLLAVCALIVFLAPNVKQAVGRVIESPLLTRESASGRAATYGLGASLACLTAYIITQLDSFSEFLYFQF